MTHHSRKNAATARCCLQAGHAWSAAVSAKLEAAMSIDDGLLHHVLSEEDLTPLLLIQRTLKPQMEQNRGTMCVCINGIARSWICWWDYTWAMILA